MNNICIKIYRYYFVFTTRENNFNIRKSTWKIKTFLLISFHRETWKIQQIRKISVKFVTKHTALRAISNSILAMFMKKEWFLNAIFAHKNLVKLLGQGPSLNDIRSFSRILDPPLPPCQTFIVQNLEILLSNVRFSLIPLPVPLKI